MLTYYSGKTILVTGGSGFLGAALIYRIVSAIEFGRLYILQRGGQSRLSKRWHRHLPPDTARWLLEHKRVFVLDGDMMKPNLGLSEQHIRTLKSNVHIIIHAASSINLTQPLQRAWRSIVQATEAVAQLSLCCNELERFVYVSTAYCNTNLCTYSSSGDVQITEDIFPLLEYTEKGVPPQEEYEELQARGSTRQYEYNDFPWGYGYAKHLAERLVTDMFTRHGKYSQLLIVRPSVIGPAESFPFPGYAVPMSTPMTVVAAILANHIGVNLKFSTRLQSPEIDATLDEVPVDTVVDRLLAHLAYQTEGCVHAVSGKGGRIPFHELERAIYGIRWLPWRFRVIWLKGSWHSKEQHLVSRMYKLFGASFDFSQEKTVQLYRRLPSKERGALRLFKTVDGGEYDLVSRRKQIYQCAVALSNQMYLPYRLFYRLLWYVWLLYVVFLSFGGPGAYIVA